MKVKFYTLGCKVNQYETQALLEDFLRAGYRLSNGSADIYVVNTCSVTQRADSKCRQLILRIKRENPKAKIVVTGCWAQLNQEDIKRLGVNYIVPQDKKPSLLEIISGGKPTDKDIWSLKITDFFRQRAFVKVQDGCDYFCSFCKIPFLRGRSKSRDKQDVLEEIERLTERFLEIVLCGINLGLYGRDLELAQGLAGLVNEILKIKKLGRLRLSSLEPSLIDEDIFSLFTHPKVCPHIHLPFQSGDDRILKMICKKETVSLYEEVVNKFRKFNPHIAISCDLMVGFPFEDELAFCNTVDFIKRIKPMRIHIFRFSPRENTVFSSWKVKGQRVISQRYNFLKKLAQELELEYKKIFLGKTLNMLTEEFSGSYTLGYAENYIKVWLKGKVELGKLLAVKVVGLEGDRAMAEPI